MAVSIIIVGGLPVDTDRLSLLDTLNERTSDDVEWDWIKSDASTHFEPRRNDFNRLIGRLRRIRGEDDKPRVVKLYNLHPRSAHQLYRAYPDPVLVPPGIGTADELIDWILSPAANLIPRVEWSANTKEAALVAILCKLIRNKSWNRNTQGHEWTKEADLLGQSPVSRREHQEVLIEAIRMLPTLWNKLLLAKGSSGGKTPKEWCIKLGHVTAVKKAVISRSFASLLAVAELADLVRRITTDEDRRHRLDEDVVSERIRQICRDRD
jgi:hypothetical protein